MTKTYSEQRQDVYFKAARDLLKIATQILDDVQNPVELQGRNAAWAQALAKRHAHQAAEMEDRGWECGMPSGHVQGALRRSHATYSKSIDAFQDRLRAVGVDPKDVIAEAERDWLPKAAA